MDRPEPAPPTLSRKAAPGRGPDRPSGTSRLVRNRLERAHRLLGCVAFGAWAAAHVARPDLVRRSHADGADAWFRTELVCFDVAHALALASWRRGISYERHLRVTCVLLAVAHGREVVLDRGCRPVHVVSAALVLAYAAVGVALDQSATCPPALRCAGGRGLPGP